jgi:hypothetical protein
VGLHETEIDSIQRWAARHAIIRRVWIFGSRARGTHRPDSDLDLAVEHDASPGDSNSFTTWICEADVWRSEFGPELSAPLDLQSYIAGKSPTIQAGLDESSLLVYERAI